MTPINIWLSALRRRQFDFLLLVFLALCSLSADASPPPSGVAPVNLPAGGFGIDGNLIPNTPAADVGDWLLCPEAGLPGTGGAVLDKAGLLLNATTTFHFIDGYGNVGTDLIFSGGLKWTDNPNTWRWTTGKPSSKTEINNALMHIATDAEGHIWVTISADRLSTSGDSYIDFEFLQNTLTRNSNGTFTSTGPNGGRTTNDVLLSLAFTGGGKVADFFAWMWRPNGSGGFAYADVTASMPAGRVFAALNSNTVAVPYGAFGKTNYAANAFAEAAVDLTALLGNFDQCLSFGFKTIMIKTKASASTTASIEDFLDPIQYSLKIGPSADAGPDQTRCTEGASTDFPLNGVATAGLNPVASASWSLVAGTATIDSLDALATTAHVFSETATFRLTVVQSNGCAATDDVILSVQQPPVCAIAGVTSTCVRTTNTFTAPVGMTTYAWSVTGNGFISGVATQQTVKVVAGEVCGAGYTVSLVTRSNVCTVSCASDVLVTDTTLPVLTCPPDRVLNCPANTSTNATGVATATDSCSRVRVTYSDAVTNGCGVSQIIARTWTATDECGNNVSCTQMITVRDITAPTMTCPVNRTLDCPADTSTAPNGVATATDLCGAANVTFNDVMTTNCGNTFVIARTWTATDLCGNSTSCVQTLTVRDITPPVITCPTNLTLQCPADTTANATGTATATDACNRVTITYSDSVTNQCGGTSTIRRTWTATDDCGNKSTCLQTITVRDTTPPVITCPPNRTLDCPADTSTNNTGVATATDACGTVTITFTDAVTNGCGGTKTIIRTWRAVDQCGNAATCAQTISVRDITPPVITCPSDRTLDCPANTSTNNTGVATATDTCSSVVITRVDTVTTNCGNTYTILRRWTATDSCNNSSSCIQTIVVRDITPPLITCPPNLTLECPANTTTNATGVATASDTCGTVTISFSDSVANNCGNTKVISRTWHATDQCGNQSSCVQTITVRDTRPPTITSPANVTLECGASTAPSATGNATAQDTCSAVTVSYSDIVSNACGGTRLISRRWTAVDSCANSTNAVQTITVRDTTAPALTLPSNRVLDCPGDTRTNVTGVATAVDICGSIAISYSDVVSNSCGITRTVRRTWTATDQCGNSTNGLQTITVRDTAPTISCPTVRVQCVDDVPAACTNLAAFRAAGGVANDTCDAALDFALISDSGLVGRCPGTVTRVYRVTDDCGLFAQCTQTITVDDTIGPVLTCPTNRTVECGLSLDPANTGRATATDNCTTNVSITYTDALVPSEYNINFYAADPDLNTGPYGPTYLRLGPASLPRPVARSLDPLRNAVAYAPSGQLDALTSLGGEPMALGQVVPFEAVIELSGSPGPERGKIEFTVDWATHTTSNDRFGFDTNYMVYCAFVDAADPGCIDPNYNARVDSFSSRLVNTGTIDEQIRGTFQISGLDIGDRVVVEIWMVFDSRMPEHVGGTIAAQLVAAEKALTPPEPITVGSKTISIGNLNKTTSLPPAQTQPPLGPLPPQPPVLPGVTVSVMDRTWAATDDCGNRSTCVQRFTVRDTTGPVIIAPDVVLECPADTSTNNTGTATAQDACGSVTVSVAYSDIVSNSCGGTKTVWRTWTATDQNNNTNSLVQTITVRDTIKPTIVCPPNRVLECPADTRTNVTGVATAQDGCGQVTIGYSDAVLSGCGGTKVITRTWTAVDTCGNSASCVQTIAVQDTTAPTLVCQPYRSVSAEETWTFDTPTATDNCGTVTVRVLNTTTNMLGDGGCITTCAWEAVDECGNRSTCQQTITAAAPVSLVLEILRSTPGQVILRWPALPTGVQLEACDDLTSLNWVPVSATPVTSNGFNTVEIPLTSAQKFYRLYKPGL